MVKEPRPGRVKTRLGRDIGMTVAAWWFRHRVAALLRELQDPRWTLAIAVSPDREGLASRVWPAGVPRVPQGRGDLGRRMARVMRAAPPGPVIVVGADIPALRRRHAVRAFRSLGRSASVIGPATDGGYWLVGVRHPPKRSSGLFRNVRWSTGHALADTLPTLPQPVAIVNRLSDVDRAADLHR